MGQENKPESLEVEYNELKQKLQFDELNNPQMKEIDEYQTTRNSQIDRTQNSNFASIVFNSQRMSNDQDEYMDQSFRDQHDQQQQLQETDESPRVQTVLTDHLLEISEEGDDFSMKENFDQVHEQHQHHESENFPLLRITSLRTRNQ